MELAIDIIAIVVAGLSIGLVRHLHVRLTALEDALTEADEEIEVEEGPQELWLADGEVYAADKAALEAACPSAVAFCTYEGVPCAVVPGQGVVSLHKLLSEKPRVASIK